MLWYQPGVSPQASAPRLPQPPTDEVLPAIWPIPQQAASKAEYGSLQEAADVAIKAGDVEAARAAGLAAGQWLVANDEDYTDDDPEEWAQEAAEAAAANRPRRRRDRLRAVCKRLFRRIV